MMTASPNFSAPSFTTGQFAYSPHSPSNNTEKNKNQLTPLHDTETKAEFVQSMAREVAESMSQTLGDNVGVKVRISVDLPTDETLKTGQTSDNSTEISLESQAYSRKDGDPSKPGKTSVSWHLKPNAPANNTAVEDKQFQQQLQQFTQQLDQSLQQLLNTMPQSELQSPWLNSYAPSPINLNALPFNAMTFQPEPKLLPAPSASQSFWA